MVNQIELNNAIKKFIIRYNEKPTLLVLSKEEYKELIEITGWVGLTFHIPFFERRQNVKNSPLWDEQHLVYDLKEVPLEMKHPENIVSINVKILQSVGFLVTRE